MKSSLPIVPGTAWTERSLSVCRPNLRYGLLVLCLVAVWAPPAFGQETGDRHGTFTIDVDCSDCHRAETWTTLLDSLRFDHSRQTRFPLTGAHTTVTCATCHLGTRFDAPKLEPNDCASCHVDIHQGEFSDRCVDCHSTTSFQDVEGRALHNQTRFPLTGAHAQISCQSCHRTEERGAFSVLDTDCASCHEPDYEAAHGTAGFPTTCESCHNTLAWAATAPLDHAALSNGFTLLGAHASLACTDCHREPTFQPVFATTDPDDCFTCHQQDYEQQHAGTDFPTTCTTCHGTETWGGPTFDHASVANGFDLVGAHTGLDCAACHNPPPDFTPIFTPADEADCLTCHEPDYQQQHAADGFPTTCLTCHNTDDWQDATLDHAALSNGFALIGAHTGLDCAACHGPPPDLVPLFNPQDQDDCLTCHQNDYQQQHAGSGFPTTCLSCHDNNAWGQTNFNHDGDYFPIFNGRHEDEWNTCMDCHTDPGNFTLFSCIDCHEHNRPDTDDEHDEVSGYVYQSSACYACHPTGED